LSQLIHPFHGYLSAFKDRELSFDELHEVYLNQITAGFEKSFGRDLLGEELSCLCFWMLEDSA
jgi:hypothetical protein